MLGTAAVQCEGRRNAPITQMCRWYEKQGGRVIFHKLSFGKTIDEHCVKAPRGGLNNCGKGIYARLDIPYVVEALVRVLTNVKAFAMQSPLHSCTQHPILTIAYY